MKKLVLLSLTAAVSITSFAQLSKTATTNITPNKIAVAAHVAPANKPAILKHNTFAKATAETTDTTYFSNNTISALLDNSVAYIVDTAGTIDSGYFFGPSVIGFTSFAERYDFGVAAQASNIDTLNLLGVISYWAGTVATNSMHTVNCQVWTVDSSLTPDQYFNPAYFLSAIPGTQLKSQAISVDSLGIDSGNVAVTMFTTPINNITTSLYVGFTPNFTLSTANGDTIGLRTSESDSAMQVGEYTLGTTDTVLYGRSVVNYMGSWIDNYYDLEFPVNYSIIPIVAIKQHSTGVASVTKNNLTIFSNFPNPATTSTNLKFSLKNNADVTIQLMDVAGHVLNTINQSQLSAGEHTVNISTANLAAGNYITIFRTNKGDAIATQITVAK